MANEPKLSVFKIQLQSDKNPSFYKRFVSNAADVSESETSVFLNLFGALIKEMDKDKYHKNKNGKAFTGQEDSEEGVQAIRHHTEKQVIEGTIDGGRWGEEWNKSDVNNKKIREKLKKEVVLTKKFYFFLHVPLDSDVGVLMIQSYSSDSITTFFSNFIKNFFESPIRGYKAAVISKYIPPSIIEDFQKKSIVKSFSFRTSMILGHLAEKTLGENGEEFVVTVKVESKKGINKSKFDKWKNTFTKGTIGIGSALKTFGEFRDGKASIRNDKNKSSSFQLSNTFEIKPVIYLDDDNIKFLSPKVIDFESLKGFCFKILEEIEENVYTT